MKKAFVLVLVILMLSGAVAVAETGDLAPSEGYTITAAGVDIALWENGSTGYQWSYELDDPTLLTVSGDEVVTEPDAAPGASSMHVWHFAAQGDGDVLISYYYERPWESDEASDADLAAEPAAEPEDADAAPPRMVYFTVTIEGGKVTQCEMEEEGEEGDDSDAVVMYQGETGGVPLEVLDGMTETDTPEGKLLSTEDGMTTILIDYEKADNSEELFAQLQDEESAGKIYNDEKAGVEVISSGVDRDADVPCVTMVYYTPTSIVEYTGYAAPNGGVLHVHTTYLMAEGEGDEATDTEEGWDEVEDQEATDAAEADDGTVG